MSKETEELIEAITFAALAYGRTAWFRVKDGTIYATGSQPMKPNE